MVIDSNAVLTPDEVAAELKVHVNTVYKHLNEGNIAASKLGTQWRVLQSEVDRIKRDGIPLENGHER